MSASLSALVSYADKLLRIREIEDYPNAANGLQVQNSGKVSRIAAAVDGTLVTARLATQAGADLLIVHHGFFWSPSHPWTGKRYDLLRHLIQKDLAVYSCHLPLDSHPRLGNNAVLFKALGLRDRAPFFFDHDQHIGFKGMATLTRKDLAKRLEKATGSSPRLIPGGPNVCRRIGVVSGGAGADVKKAADEGVDTFVTGEGPHWTYALAEELGINILYGGHYATETFGVKALAEHLSRRFRVPWLFLDHPTGL